MNACAETDVIADSAPGPESRRQGEKEGSTLAVGMSKVGETYSQVVVHDPI